MIQSKEAPRTLAVRPSHGDIVVTNGPAAATSKGIAQPIGWRLLGNTASTLGTGLWNAGGTLLTGLGNTLVAAAPGVTGTLVNGIGGAWNTGAALVTGAQNVYAAPGIVGKATALGTGLWNTGGALVGGVIGTGEQLVKGVTAVVPEVAKTAAYTGLELAKTGAYTLGSAATGLATLGAYQIPAGPEWLKEYVDPRRHRWNPYWRRGNQLAVAYEATHGAVGYHTVAKHGGQHTIDNLRGRLVPFPGAGNLSYMLDHTGVRVKRAAVSSRFANDAWHNYTRELAKRRFEVSIAPTGAAAAWTWPVALVPPTAWNVAHTFIAYPNNVTIDITYTGNIVGFSVDGAHQHGEPCNSTHTLVGYDNAGNAYVNQHYPVTAAAVVAGPHNQVLNYEDVPWF